MRLYCVNQIPSRGWLRSTDPSPIPPVPDDRRSLPSAPLRGSRRRRGAPSSKPELRLLVSTLRAEPLETEVADSAGRVCALRRASDDDSDVVARRQLATRGFDFAKGCGKVVDVDCRLGRI